MKATPKLCAVEDCDRKFSARDMCHFHYKRWRAGQNGNSKYGTAVPDCPLPESLPGETWRPVTGWEGTYQVSDLGRVMSSARFANSRHGCRRLIQPRILKPRVRKEDGYLAVSLSGDGLKVSVTVHSLVAEAFMGPRPLGHQVAHGNGVPGDNRLVNLRYATVPSNIADQVKHGTRRRTVDYSQVTESMVREIREAHALGARQVDIASEYGLHRSHVRAIVRRSIWKNVAMRTPDHEGKR